MTAPGHQGLDALAVEGASSVTKEPRAILDVKGAAAVLGCSASHISNILNGKVEGVPPIPHVRAGRLRLIRRAALMHWFERQEESSHQVQMAKE
jgi:hypothetical protein